jgi:hypothetical protein
MINISQNRLERITGVEMLLSLVALNLGEDMIPTDKPGAKILPGGGGSDQTLRGTHDTRSRLLASKAWRMTLHYVHRLFPPHIAV